MASAAQHTDADVARVVLSVSVDVWISMYGVQIESRLSLFHL